MNTHESVRSLLAAGALSCLALPAAAQCTQNWFLDLRSVEVRKVREPSGDRPYFITYMFRARHYAAGSAEVRLVRYEPHDWVSKPEYRGSLPAGDHLFPGQSAAIPSWQGLHMWRNVRMRGSPLDAMAREGIRLNDRANAAANIDRIAEIFAAAGDSELMGALVFCLDNNFTPPHMVHDHFDRGRPVIEAFLREQIESGAMWDRLVDRIRRFNITTVDGLGDFIQTELTTNLARPLSAVLNDIDKLAWATNSTYNPDVQVSREQFVFTTVSGMPARELVDSKGIVTTAGSLQALGGRRTLVGTGRGSGAEYVLMRTLLPDRCSDEEITALNLRIRTGEDDLRSGSSLIALARFTSGPSIAIPLVGAFSPATSLPNRSDRVFTMAVPSRRRSDLHSIDLIFSGPGDDWHLDAFSVSAHGPTYSGPVLAVSGYPLRRFREGASVQTFEIGCPACRVDQLLVQELEVGLLLTNDLPRYSGPLWLDLELAGQKALPLLLNPEVGSLGGKTLISRYLRLPAKIPAREILGLKLRFESEKAVSVDGVQLRATPTQESAGFTLLDISGSPLFTLDPKQPAHSIRLIGKRSNEQ
ncbi:MAG: hypothetical protein KDC87_15030 [Planctomycetes bacterium]|nr:hypothetical protein [Planctomycetota bacterium]